jgi:DNA-binding IscR family transcriptional regulator
MPELSALQGLHMSTLKQAFSVLAAEGLIVVRQGRTAGLDAGHPLHRPGW